MTDACAVATAAGAAPVPLDPQKLRPSGNKASRSIRALNLVAPAPHDTVIGETLLCFLSAVSSRYASKPEVRCNGGGDRARDGSIAFSPTHHLSASASSGRGCLSFSKVFCFDELYQLDG